VAVHTRGHGDRAILVDDQLDPVRPQHHTALGPRPRRHVCGLLDEAREEAGAPVDTDLEAIIAGARHLGIDRVAIATRWSDDVNAGLVRYLADADIEVVDTVSSARSIGQNAEMDDVTGMRLALDLGRRAMQSASSPDAVIMPGARWIAIQALEELETESGRPLFLNHASALWHALNQHGYADPVTGWGRLLASLGR